MAFLAVWIGSVRVILTATCLLVILPFVVGSRAQGQTAHLVGWQNQVYLGLMTKPSGMAVDANGTVYVADNGDNSLLGLTSSGSLGPNGTFLSGDGSPYGIAVDAAGNLFVSDNVKNEVAKETLQPGGYYKKSILPLKGLKSPMGVAVDRQGNVYVADSGSNRVIKATPFGSSYSQSLVPTSPLTEPEAVAVDASGNLYVGDTSHLRVLKEAPSGSHWTESVFADIADYAAKPIALAADAAGDIFILASLSDENNIVLKATPSGVVQTLIHSPVGSTTYAMTADAAGDVFLVSPETEELQELFAGPPTLSAVEVNSGNFFSLNFIFDKQSTLSAPVVLTQGVPYDDFTDAGSGSCGEQTSTFVFSAGETCTVDVFFTPEFPGSSYGAAVLQDASGNTIATAYLSETGISPLGIFPPGYVVSIATNLGTPSGVAVDGNGDLFVADSSSGNVYKETSPTSLPFVYTRSTIASRLGHPAGLALDGAGNVYVVTSGRVYKEAPLGGGYVQSRVFTSLTDLVAVAVDGGGNLYLTSSLGEVHKATLQANGTFVESSISSGIASPAGVAVDGSGDVFIIDTKSNDLYIETLQTNGSYHESTLALQLSAPESLAIDPNGNLYVADASHGEIDMLARKTNGGYLETRVRSGLPQVGGMTADSGGNIYYAQTDGSLNMIYQGNFQTLVLPTVKAGMTATGYQTIENIGNAPLTFPAPYIYDETMQNFPLPSNSDSSDTVSITNPYVAPPFTLNPDSTCPIVGLSGASGTLDVGQSCDYSISFTPKGRGSTYGLLGGTYDTLNEGVRDNSWNVTLEYAPLAWDVTRTSMRISPNPVQRGLWVTITITVADTDNPAKIPQGAVTVTETVGGQVMPLNGGVAVALTNGKATLTMLPTVAGTHTITAHYGTGNSGFIASRGQASFTVEP